MPVLKAHVDATYLIHQYICGDYFFKIAYNLRLRDNCQCLSLKVRGRKLPFIKRWSMVAIAASTVLP